MERRLLKEQQLTEALRSLDGWSARDNALTRRWEFRNFAEALDFVNRVGVLAEEADHHPDITFGWGYAQLELTTHDRGGVTDVDIALAKKIDVLGRDAQAE